MKLEAGIACKDVAEAQYPKSRKTKISTQQHHDKHFPAKATIRLQRSERCK